MRHFKKTVTLFLMLTALFLVPVLQLQAASNIPGQVKNLTAKAVSETSIQLNWSKVSGATGYYVYQVEDTGKTKKVATTNKTTYTVKKLKVNQAYTYQVYAYKKVKKQTYKSETASPKKTVSTYIKTPKAPKSLKVGIYGNKTATLQWSAGQNANGYYVYLYDEKTDTYKQLAKTKSRSYELKKLKDGEKYKVRVQSYRTVSGVTKIGASADLVVTGREFSDAVKSVHGRYWNATLKSDTTGVDVSTGKKRVIKKGTSVTASAKSPATVVVTLKNGTKVKVPSKKLRFGNLKVTTKEYSTSTKEAFVNAKGYTSKTNYLVWINQYTTSTNVFKKRNGKWKLVRRMPCIVGRYGNTPMGVYSIIKQGWGYGGPVLFFTWSDSLQKGNAFHKYVDWHKRGAYSGGCIRLPDADLNYLVKYCKPGTTVVSY